MAFNADVSGNTAGRFKGNTVGSDNKIISTAINPSPVLEAAVETTKVSGGAKTYAFIFINITI